MLALMEGMSERAKALVVVNTVNFGHPFIRPVVDYLKNCSSA
jgi:hypothetical protein